MKNLYLIFAGVIATIAASFSGIVLLPRLQLSGLEPMTEEAEMKFDAYGRLEGFNPADQEPRFPQAISGLAQQGKQAYIELGCMYCHSQQVRRDDFGTDFERNWGNRQTVARDYILQERVLLGTMRTGPDLTTVGARLPDANWHHIHLYDPWTVSGPTDDWAGSIMPRYRFLYQVQEIKSGAPSANALRLPPDFAPPAGYEVVPTRKAEALVAYLLSLKLNYELPEAKFSE